MKFRESETVELKQTIVKDLKKEIIAFANTQGGTLYIGVADNGQVVGVENPDNTIQQITNMVNNAVRPDLTMFLHCDVLDMEDNQIIAVHIQRGTNRPYYLAGKGLRPEGVYVRRGTSAYPASEEAIRQMIKETDGDSYEQMRCLNQDLTFESAEEEFARREVTFGPGQKKTLGLMNTHDLHTNLGLLLSDQCPHTIKAAVFEGTGQTVFRNRKEFTGSLLKQMNEAYEFIDFHNQLHASFEKLYRIDTRDYPGEAVREALLNSLVHRDYAISAATLISIYEDRIEFVSAGGLVPGISMNDIMIGLSVCRNPGLADIFYRLQLIEAYGTGIQKIMSAYEGTGQTPKLQVSDHAFKITLPNLNYCEPTLLSESPAPYYAKEPVHTSARLYSPAPHYTAAHQASVSYEDRVLKLAADKGFVSRRDVENLLDIGQTAAGRLLKKLVDLSLLGKEGRGPKTKYFRINL